MPNDAASIEEWATGRKDCTGPAAELIVQLLGGEAGVELSALMDDMDREWKRAKNHVVRWRQISFTPQPPLTIPKATFDDLFPQAALPADQYAHGFPFVEFPPPVYRYEPARWIGVLPVDRKLAPRYIWTLKQAATFGHREPWWETAERSITGGHLHVNSLLTIALAGAFFLRRLVAFWSLNENTSCVLQLDVNGMDGRGLVGHHRSGIPDLTDEPSSLCEKDHLTGTVTSSLREIRDDARSVGISLVSEVAVQVRPDLATPSTLKRELELALEEDRRTGHYRWLGFLDA